MHPHYVSQIHVQKTHADREIMITRISIIITLVLTCLFFADLFSQGYRAFTSGKTLLLAEAAGFGLCMFFMTYGSLLYQVCLAGYYQRKKAHTPTCHNDLYQLYSHKAPALSILIPSYKEEKNVIWQTMVSAALSEYPAKNVVLLIDDPYKPNTLEDIVKLEQSRKVVNEMQELFAVPFARYQQELAAFLEREQQGTACNDIELNRLSILYDEIASWLENMAQDFAAGTAIQSLSYDRKFFANDILLAPATRHRALARRLRAKIGKNDTGGIHFIKNHYHRIAALFNVHFSSFERKKYANLSHEANKAMNLNSYIALVGKSWKEVMVGGRLELQEAAPYDADFTIPAADYIDTLDADTVMLAESALRVTHIMEQPGNEKIAVVQSSCSTVPGAPIELERITGACLDVQFQTHQGYTAWNATFWVGANAMLRYRALEDIKEIHYDNGQKVAVYIQDRTVIEDTESSIDLVEKGWKLYNYPERMTFSPTPPDFGSLLIQRRRWANGGLIILPKLFSYARKSPLSLALIKEFLMRFNYLASTTLICLSMAIIWIFSLGEKFESIWLPLSTLPCMLLYARDLKNCGYKYSDVLRAAALTVMLLPVLMGGVCKQFQQMVTGKKIPFGRTPKIPGRTSAPALYCIIEVMITVYCLYNTFLYMLDGNLIAGGLQALNSIFMVYALICFMGIRETFQDIATPALHFWKNSLHQVDILSASLVRKAAMLFLPARRKI